MTTDSEQQVKPSALASERLGAVLTFPTDNSLSPVVTKLLHSNQLDEHLAEPNEQEAPSSPTGMRGKSSFSTACTSMLRRRWLCD